MLFILVKSLHLATLVGLLAASAFKNVRLSRAVTTQSDVYLALLADKVSGLAAAGMIATGLMMVLGPARQQPQLLAHPVFWSKMALLSIASILILATKGYLRKNAVQNSTVTVKVPGKILFFLRVDLVSLVLLVLLALAMKA